MFCMEVFAEATWPWGSHDTCHFCLLGNLEMYVDFILSKVQVNVDIAKLIYLQTNSLERFLFMQFNEILKLEKNLQIMFKNNIWLE